MNKTFSQLPVLMVVLISAACGPYQPEPLSLYHPAHVDAAMAPERPRSQTLAYTAADVPSSRPVLSAASEPAKGEPAMPKTGGPQTVIGEGKVVATVPSGSQIVIEHGEIKGFMDAMTMGYRVAPLSLLEGLGSGDRVRFTIDVPSKTIVKIEKIK
jgi:Cu/Ag efflux protein CusF